MIAMALLTRPELLIADEPTTALDVTVQAQILRLLRELRDELNMSLLFITHNLSIVRKLADSVAVMQNGRCVEQNTAATLLKAPQHPIRSVCLIASPRVTRFPCRLTARRCCALRGWACRFLFAKGFCGASSTRIRY